MVDRRQQFQQNIEQSSVSSTSDVGIYGNPRQRFFARSPAMVMPSGLERVEEEPSNMADSSTDASFRPKPNYYGEQCYASHDGPFKKPAQQGYYHCPMTPPYYNNNRYACGNAMCREAHYCYDQGNRECFNPAMPMPPNQPHYYPHDCQAGYPRQLQRPSPLFVNPNHSVVKRPEHDARLKHEWPRPGSHAQSPATPAQYLAALSGKESATIPPSTGTSSRSISLEPFMHHSNFSSPRQSARLNRKRAMSSSPLSIDSIDINSLIRTSPDSLIAYINAPRISSAGSYGHLSANGISPSPKPQRSPSMRSPFFGCWQRTPTATSRSQVDSIKETKERVNNENDKQKKETSMKEVKQEPMEENMLVDNNNNNNHSEGVKITTVSSPSESDKKESFSDIENDENIETVDKDQNNNEFRCLWKDCDLLLQSQDELVKHVNTDHIKKERRDFTCYWIDCQREQKPFKAQYMLVVHMRRHTGEKPNKCPYEGCDKAYSRLENLKTHERSHTGERPYVCEFANCTKAFTNASDRAKHQNRTHSSVKPYICTVANCTKRYTDPSSLRKHKKTCHPEHFAGAKKAKIDEAKTKSENSKGTSTGKESVQTGKGNNQVANGTQQTSSNVNPTSPLDNGPRELTKQNIPGTNMANMQQIDFSPQSFQGDITSSSSYVDSPQSNNFVIDSSDQYDEPSHVRVNRDNNQSRSPQAPGLSQFRERAEIGESGGDVLVETSTIANQISLPTINKQNEVGKWIADVTQRMSNASKYTGADVRENPVADYSSRRSSESGVSSYMSSRRSSEVSSHYNRQPHGSLPPHTEEELTEERAAANRQINVNCMPKLPPIPKWKTSMLRNDEIPRTSPIPDTFDQRRSSSGYGSHHNLTIIRSPVFHKVPVQNTTKPEASTTHNRRMSDSVVCEADSSNRYMPLYNNNSVPRRSSEPARHYNTGASNEVTVPNYRQLQATQRSHSDAYLSQRREMNTYNGNQPRIPKPLETGQKLTHYPYSMETSNQITPHPPVYPHGSLPARNPPQSNLWEYEQHISQQLSPLQEQQTFYQQNNMVPARDTSLDIMVNGIGNLNTSEAVEDTVLPDGPSNMVINDMNTLLNSLIEEDQYLEKKHGQETMTNTLSHIF